MIIANIHVHAMCYGTPQNWHAEDTRERQAVVQSCHLLQHVSPAVLSELAKDIRWETISPNQSEPPQVIIGHNALHTSSIPYPHRNMS